MDQEHSAAPPSSSPSASAALGGKAASNAGQPGHRKPSGGGSGPFRKWLRRAGWALGLCVLLCAVALAATLAALRSETAQGWLTEKINTAMEAAPHAGATPAGTVTPAQMAPAAMGAGRPSVQSNTNVTVTVPPGTTAEQATFLQNAAQQSFSKANDDKLARDLAVYAP